MAHYQDGDLVPYGSTLARMPGGWVADDNEATTCGHCFKDLELIDTTPENGPTSYHYGKDEHQSSKGVQCCSEACAALYDLDVTAGLDCLARYLERLGSSLPPIGVGFNRANVAGYVRTLLQRHTYALKGGHHLEEVIKEAL